MNSTSTHYLCRNPSHSEIIRNIFPNINGGHGGVDLDNVEVKESRSDWFTVEKKDLVSEFFLFYSHPKNVFFIVPTETIRPFMKSPKRGFRHSQIRKLSTFKTSCYQIIKDFVNKLREEYFKRNYQLL